METCIFHVGLILLMLYFMISSASKDDVSSPNDVTFGLNGMFYLFWEWKFSNANCSLIYEKQMKSLRNGYNIKEKDNLSHWEREIERTDNLDLNDKLCLFVKAECNSMTIQTLNRTVQLAPGDDRTSVKNFHCVWHYQEHVKCTWQPGPKTPSNTKYRILYWIKDTKSNSKTERLYTPAEFSDLLETGRNCELIYSSKDTKTVGCQFLLNKRFSDYVQIAMVVTDTSNNIKPYIYYGNADSIAKMKPPQIIEANRTSKRTHVSWNKSQDTSHLEYELLLTSLSSGREERYKMTNTSTDLHHILPDVTYTVKVRVKLSDLWLSKKESYTWSEWSKEKILEGKDGEKLTSIILPLIVSVVIIVVAIFLLVHMEKLKALICPQIPDPGRMFAKDLQQWLKPDINLVYSKPEKEEICTVYLIEGPPATKCA